MIPPANAGGIILGQAKFALNLHTFDAQYNVVLLPH